MDKDKILKMTCILAAIVVIAGSLARLAKRDSMSLAEYAELNGAATPSETDMPPSRTQEPQEEDESEESPEETDPPAAAEGLDAASTLTGASLNGISQLEQRTLLEEGFYYEPISDDLRRYMTGVSYPASHGTEDIPEPEITFDDLMYVHILHYDFDGNPTEGELVCNKSIAADLAEIFQELYRNEYRLEKVLLIEAYDGDDLASMEDNNTSCFNYRPVEGSGKLSKHAYGLAIDINPLYNPYITYTAEGSQQVSPASALPYADRGSLFPYKIDEEDLCYKLFTSRGFTWGGNWNNVKDYQHFQKAK